MLSEASSEAVAMEAMESMEAVATEAVATEATEFAVSPSSEL
jgi:hypothetical protein